MSWWEFQPGYPIRTTNMHDQAEDQEIWVCGTCHALVVSPTKHVKWHEEITQPKAVTVVVDAESIMAMAERAAREKES